MQKRHVGVLALIGFLAVLIIGWPAFAHPQNYRAHLSGDSEVPPVATNAQGEAIFQLNGDGTALAFKLNAANIENVRAAHIHMGVEGVNGGVVAFLYGGPTIPGRFQGTLAQGTITSADLIGPLAGASLADLISLIEAGQTYVNVHTDQNPGGEIRGQIR